MPTPPTDAGTRGSDRGSRLPAWMPPWLAAGLVVFAGGTALRLYQLGALEREAGSTAEMARWNVANVLPENVVHVAVMTMLAAAIAYARRGLAERLVVLALIGSAVSGWPISPARFLPSTSRSFGASGVLLTIVGAALVFAVLLGLSEGLRRRAKRRTGLAGWPGIGLAAVLGATPIVLASLGSTPHMDLREPVRELLVDIDSLEFVDVPDAAREAAATKGLAEWFAATRRVVITPAVYTEYDVGDKAALLFPPGTTVAFTVRPEDGPVTLRTAAGIARDTYEDERPAPLEARFEVRVDGESRFTHVQRVSGDVPAAERAWRHVGGAAGLPLEPGQRVELSITLTPGDAARALDDEALLALRMGFADPVLERVMSRPREHSSPDFPNVVLVVMDTLRADRTSTYGYARPTTPALDRLAARGLVYENAYSTSSWTWPSTASLLCGMYPDEHGVLSNEQCTLARPIDTVAEALQRAGWTTAAFACNPLIAANRGYAQGFERFEGVDAMTPSRAVMPEVLQWIRDHRGTRFFLYLHLIDPHSPHVPDEDLEAALVGVPRPTIPAEILAQKPDADAFDWLAYELGRAIVPESGVMPDPTVVLDADQRRWLSEIYDASVATGDRALGQVLDLLEELAIGESTMVVFTSDHGEELLDHGFLAHGHALHEELVRVPLVLAGPEVPRGQRVALPVSNRHVAPTLAAAAHTTLRTLGEPAFDLIRPALVKEADVGLQTSKGRWNARTPIVLEGLRRGDWKLVWALHEEGEPRPSAPATLLPVGGDADLFDLSRDPTESLDLFGASIDVGEGMARELAARCERLRARRLAGAVGAGDQASATLTALGYSGTADGDRASLDVDALIRRAREAASTQDDE